VLLRKDVRKEKKEGKTTQKEHKKNSLPQQVRRFGEKAITPHVDTQKQGSPRPAS